MCCTTFLHQSELNVPTSNNDLNKLLADVRKATGEDWQVVELVLTKPKTFFKKEMVSKRYELYKYVGGCGPWQQINFYRDDVKSSINLRNGAELVIAFLLGILSGVNTTERKQDV